MQQHIDGAGSVGGIAARVSIVHNKPAQGLASWAGAAYLSEGDACDLAGEDVEVRVVDSNGAGFTGRALVTTGGGDGTGKVELLGSGPLNRSGS